MFTAVEVLARELIAYAGQDNTIKIIKWAEGKEMKTLQAMSETIIHIIKLNDNMIVSDGKPNTIVVWK